MYSPNKEYSHNFKGTLLKAFDLWKYFDGIKSGNDEWENGFIRGKKMGFSNILEHATGRWIEYNPNEVLEVIESM